VTRELTLELDPEQYDQLQKRAERFGFETAETYAKTIVETVLDELESEPSEEDAVRDRLEDLGYL